MSTVYCSVSQALDETYKDIKQRTEKNHAIYGTSCFHQTLITEDIGVRPVISGKVVEEEELREINTGTYGYGRKGHNYRVKENLRLEDFNSATKDELYLFITMAHPSVLKDENLKRVIGDRLKVVYQEELSVVGVNEAETKQQQQEDMEKVMYIYDSVSKAVKGRGYEVYYAEGYQPEETSQNQAEETSENQPE